MSLRVSLDPVWNFFKEGLKVICRWAKRDLPIRRFRLGSGRTHSLVRRNACFAHPQGLQGQERGSAFHGTSTTSGRQCSPGTRSHPHPREARTILESSIEDVRTSLRSASPSDLDMVLLGAEGAPTRPRPPLITPAARVEGRTTRIEKKEATNKDTI